MKQPKKSDNSWLGNMGITSAILTDKQGNIIGTCMDTPNNVAYACSINSNVANASGICGNYDMIDIRNRANGLDAEYHKQYVKFKTETA